MILGRFSPIEKQGSTLRRGTSPGHRSDPMNQDRGVSTCVFLDVGGVLLTDGWGRHVR